MFEIDKFIMEVKKRPGLWNPTHVNYSNRAYKKHLWQHIASKMFEDFKNYSLEKREEILDDLQRKWKNLKDYRRKVKQGEESSSTHIVNRRAKYIPLLSFLDIIYKKGNRKKLNKEKKKSFLQNGNSGNDAIDVESENNDESIWTPQTTMMIAEEDTDRSFLLSMLPDIKTMDEQQKFQFKLGMMTLINSVKYDNAASLPEHSLRHSPVSINIKCEESISGSP